MSLTTFTQESILEGVRYDPETKCAAVYDIINKVTGCSASPHLRKVETYFGRSPGAYAIISNSKELWLCSASVLVLVGLVWSGMVWRHRGIEAYN
jgi:hypothetical protein